MYTVSFFPINLPTKTNNYFEILKINTGIHIYAYRYDIDSKSADLSKHVSKID